MVAARPGDPMTFEQWFERNAAEYIREFGERSRCVLPSRKKEFAEVWNAALDAVLAEVQPIYNKIFMENLKVKS
jgi:hypothetical protein